VSREFIAEQAELARQRGQGRHIPATQAQALHAEAGAATAWADFPGRVQDGDALIGRDRYWRAAYNTRICQLREANIAAGRTEPRDWVLTVTDAELRKLRGEAITARNQRLGRLADDALRGDDGARERIIRDVMTPAFAVWAERDDDLEETT
jgi:hypothetical protein